MIARLDIVASGASRRTPRPSTPARVPSRLGTRAGVEGRGVRLLAPLATMSKRAIIETGLRLGVDYALTVSCYQADADGAACGRCDSCRLRREGFAAAGVPDPTHYRRAVV